MGDRSDRGLHTRHAKTFAEFFAGIGLVRAGLASGNWRCVYANDIEPKKRVMYEGHFGPAPHYHTEDIWQTDEVLQRIDSPFLATASFPCVDLSLAGHWRGFDGNHSSSYFGFLEVVRAMARRPKIVLLENVSGFLTARRGEDFRKAVSQLASLGYWIDAMVIDARWFVPQSRPRTFVIGLHDSIEFDQVVRRDTCFSLDDPWAGVIERGGDLRPRALRAAMDEIQLETGWASVDVAAPTQQTYDLAAYIDLGDDQEWWTDDITQRHFNMMEAPSRARVENLLDGDVTAVGTAFRRTRRGKTRCEVRFDIAGCLRTPKGGSAKQIVVAITRGQLRMRWMSAREYARLQGIGDFKITVPPIQAMYGFGDAVCVPVVQWIDKQILTPVFESTSIETAPSAIRR